jgi:hypothetical protein
MSSIRKEYPYAIITNNKGVEYKVELETGIAYGTKGKPIKNIPSLPWYENCGNYSLPRMVFEILQGHTYLPRKIADALMNFKYGIEVLREIYIHTEDTTREALAANISIDKLLSIILSCYKETFGNDYAQDCIMRKEYELTIEKTIYQFTDEEAEFYHNLYYGLRGYYKQKKYRTYIEHAYDSLNYRVFGDGFVYRLADYIEYCEKLEWDIEAGDFRKNYLKAKATYIAKQDEIASKVFAANQTKYNLFFEDDEYITVIPTTRLECIEEGTALNNCVGGIEWNSHLRSGRRRIVFIRRKSDPKKSYIACDMTNGGKIIQYLAKNNMLVTELTAKLFKNKYQNYLNSLNME